MTKIAFPTNGNNLNSKILNHFGRAENFLIYDLKKEEFELKVNPEAAGKPIAPPDFLANLEVDSVVCFGLGKKAINKFLNHNIKVYKAKEELIGKNLELFKESKLKENDESC